MEIKMLNLDLFFEFVNVKIGNRIGFSLNKIFEKSNKIEIENILFLYGNKIKDFLDVENYLFYEEDDVKFLIENNFEYLVGNLD
jgi:hypothetical protein